MKPKTLTTGRIILSLLIVGLTVGLVSWDHKQTPGRFDQAINDTTPKKSSEKKIRDLDEALEELNKGEWKEELEKAMKEVKESMKNFDGDKIKLELEKAFKEVDMEKIQQELKTSMEKIDFNKIKEELNTAMKQVDMEKLQIELKESLAKVDWDKIKGEMDKVKIEMDKVKEIDMKQLTIEMDKVKEEMKNLGPKLEKELGNAKIQIEKAKEELKEYKGFVDGLEKDGLLKKDGYSLKHQDGELFIDGKKASAETYNKYRAFLEKHKRFTIKKSDDNFNIDVD